MVNYQILNLRWELLLGKEGGLGWAINYICDVVLCNLGCGHVDVFWYYYFLFLFCHSVVSDSLWPRDLQHARLPFPLLSPQVCSNSCPLSRWCHPTISSSIVPFSSCLQSFPASGSFQVSWLFTSDDQVIGASASASVLPVNIQGLFLLGLTGLISLLSKGLASLFQHHSSKASNFWCLAFLMVQLSHPYMTTEKTIALTRWTFVSKIMSLLFNMLSRFVIAFLPSSKCLLISWLQSLSAVILKPKKIKSVAVSIFFPMYLPWSDGTGCHDLQFVNVEF